MYVQRINKRTYVLIAFFSIFVGAISGLLGGGGGMLAVPILLYIAKVDTKEAHASAILIMLLTSIFSSIFYLTNKSVEIDFTTLTIVIGMTVAGSVLGTALFKKLKNDIISIVFVMVMLVAGVMMVVRSA